MRIRRVLASVLLGVLLLLALDLALSTFGIQDGLFRGRPLPPFGAIVRAEQRDWLDWERRSLELPPAERGAALFDRDLGWTNRPDWTSLDGERHFTSLGARGEREVGARPAPGHLRVVTFGDSFVFGAQVPDDASFQHRMEQLDPRLEVLNFGVNAYGTDQALLRFRSLADRLAADVALIGLMPENVGRNVNRYRPLFAPSTRALRAKPRFVLEDDRLELVPLPFEDQRELLAAIEDGSVLERLAEHEHWARRTLPAPLWRSSLVRIGAAWTDARERRPACMMVDPSGEPYRVTVAILESFHREALASGARHAAVLLLPARVDLDGLNGGAGRYWAGMLAELEQRGVPTIDLADVLLAVDPDAARAPGEEGLFSGLHYGRAGNDAVARALVVWIAERLPGRGPAAGDDG